MGEEHLVNKHIIKREVSTVSGRVWVPSEVFPSRGSHRWRMSEGEVIGTRRMRTPGAFFPHSSGESKCEKKPSLKC